MTVVVLAHEVMWRLSCRGIRNDDCLFIMDFCFLDNPFVKHRSQMKKVRMKVVVLAHKVEIDLSYHQTN